LLLFGLFLAIFRYFFVAKNPEKFKPNFFILLSRAPFSTDTHEIFSYHTRQ